MINETKSKFKKMLEDMENDKCALRDELDELSQRFDEFKADAHSTEMELKARLESSVKEVNELTNELDETKDRLQVLLRDHQILQEENDLYRRQGGGRCGGELLQADYDNLQKEFAAVVEENQQLRYQTQHNNYSGIDGVENSYGFRGSQTRNTVAQVRQEYEETIAKLNDEKRELLMKCSATTTNTDKAEKRVYERDQEIEKLKAEVTSLQLQLQRAVHSLEKQSTKANSFQSPNQSSFYSAQEEEDEAMQRAILATSPPRARLSSHSGAPRSSPGIDRAKREKAQQEQNLRKHAFWLSFLVGLAVQDPIKPIVFHISTKTVPDPFISISATLACTISSCEYLRGQREESPLAYTQTRPAFESRRVQRTQRHLGYQANLGGGGTASFRRPK